MYQKPTGMRYQQFLSELHASHLFDWYLEIGCRTGETLAPSRSKTIAVDPFFRAEQNIIGAKPELHVFQTTSDAFFAGGFLDRQGIRLSLSFIDGMHLVDFALRDLINVEAHSAAEGMILLHDCCPFSRKMTTRDLGNLPGGPWTGDVWKLIPILRQYRPDLTVTVLNCRPSGLVVLSGLDPMNRVLAENQAEILREWQELDIEDYGVARFNDSFAFAEGGAEARAGFPLFAACRRDEAQALTPAFVTP